MMIARLRRRVRGEGGWFGVISLLIIPLAIVGIPLSMLCFYVAFHLT